MKNPIKYFILFFTALIFFTTPFTNNTTYAQEKQLKEGDKIVIELFYGRKLHGAFVRMDSTSITYISSGGTLFFKPVEKDVKIEKIKKIYNKDGWVIYVTPKRLRNYDYPTSELNIGYSTMFFNKHTYRFGNSREHKGGLTISGGGTIKKWIGAELKLNALDRKSTRLNSSHIPLSRMPSSA